MSLVPPVSAPPSSAAFNVKECNLFCGRLSRGCANMEYDQTRNESPNKKARKSTPSQKKACKHCTDSKARCDLQRPCSRCVRRAMHCEYVTDRPVPPGPHFPTNEKPAPGMGPCGVERMSPTGYFGMPTPPDAAATEQPEGLDAQSVGVNFSDLELAATIDGCVLRAIYQTIQSPS